MNTTPGTQYALFESVEALPIDKAASPAKDRRYSDYVVYMDESGDHSLVSVDPDYPVFVLALCVFHKRHYSEKIIPAVEKLKCNYFGHDSVVLHETDIRKQKGKFAFLGHLPTRREFMDRLSDIMVQSNFILIACVVDKARLGRGEGAASNPYHIALDICLQCLRNFLAEKRAGEPADPCGGRVSGQKGRPRAGTGIPAHLRWRRGQQPAAAVQHRVCRQEDQSPGCNWPIWWRGRSA